MNKTICFVIATLFATGCPNADDDHASPDMAEVVYPTKLASLSTTRVAASSAVGKDGTLYVIGGYGDKGNLASMEAYDPVTNTWSARASLPKPRYFGAAHARADGKILYFGGLTSTTGYTKDINLYDPASDSWSKLGEMNYQRSTITTAVAPDGKIYFIGGAAPDDPEIDRPDASGCTTLVESYDPATEEWKQYKRLAMPICDAAAAASADGKIYLSGGYSGFALQATLQIFDPVADQWTMLAEPSLARYAHAMVAAGDKLYVIGGDILDGRDFVATDSVEVYTPATDTWTTGTALPTGRASAAGARLLDGRFVLAGGQTGVLASTAMGLTKLQTVVAWNPKSDAWTMDDAAEK